MLDPDGPRSVRHVCRLMCLKQPKEYVDSAGLIVQRMFNALVKMDRTKEMKPDPEVAEANKVWIIRVINELQEMLTDKSITSIVRETVVDLILKNLMHMDAGIPRGWSWKFVEGRGLLTLLDLASQIPEICDYPVSSKTRQHVAICLQRLHDDMVFDTKRAIFKEKVDYFLNKLISRLGNADESRNVRIKLASFLITMLQGPVDIGLNLVTNDQVTAIMLQMADSDDHLMQSVAAELIVMTVSKHERATSILKVGIPILRKLYNSDDENVKVRALVVLIFRFACEGLSYLSLDADVKEWIVADSLLLRALVLLAQSAGALCVYTMASIYVNLTNAYEKPNVDEELVKLAQFAKHHVPEIHPKDTEEFVEKRVRTLVEEGAVAACVAVSRTESKNAMELLARYRAVLAFTEVENLRGRIISEGGTKLCLKLTKEATGEGKIKAAHAIAKLGVKANPEIAFPGQRAYEVVKPLVDLIHPEIDGKLNYDALLTLTNLASMGDSVRRRILKEKSIPKIEEFWYMTDHVHLRAAAAELLLNMLFLEDFFKDTVKLWVLYAAEEDERLARASSAGFAILTEDVEANKRILDEIKSWPEVFKEIAMHEDPEVQRRGLMGIANIMESDEKLCAEVVASEIFRLLVAITKLKEKNETRIGSIEQVCIFLTVGQKL
uniref:UNC45-central domain-containing protein n=1 Tax=Heterorhabditis bacteriophora TaxID=37862 RepID=A0A1I7XFW3_HETBA